MDKDLAEQLKHAGFPQRLRYGTHYYPHDKSNIHVWTEDGDPPPDTVKAPSLEELIEACGTNLESLERLAPSMWNAWNGILGDQSVTAEGSSPIQTIARLWMALNDR